MPLSNDPHFPSTPEDKGDAREFLESWDPDDRAYLMKLCEEYGLEFENQLTQLKELIQEFQAQEEKKAEEEVEFWDDLVEFEQQLISAARLNPMFREKYFSQFLHQCQMEREKLMKSIQVDPESDAANDALRRKTLRAEVFEQTDEIIKEIEGIASSNGLFRIVFASELKQFVEAKRDTLKKKREDQRRDINNREQMSFDEAETGLKNQQKKIRQRLSCLFLGLTISVGIYAVQKFSETSLLKAPNSSPASLKSLLPTGDTAPITSQH